MCGHKKPGINSDAERMGAPGDAVVPLEAIPRKQIRMLSPTLSLLMGGRSLFSVYVEHSVHWYQHCGAGILAERDKGYFEEVERISPVRDECKLFCTGDGACILWPTIPYNGSRLFGAAPGVARRNDEIVFFPVGVFPFRVRKRDNGTYCLVEDCYLSDFDTCILYEDPGADARE